MPQFAVALIASVLICLPILWAVYFLVFYRCDLQRYMRLWTAGDPPPWLTAWEVAVTVACVFISLIIARKVALLWVRSKPMTRGEWIALLLITALVGAAVSIAPAAMMDPRAGFDALLGRKSDVCVQ